MKIDFLHSIYAPNFGSTELYKAKIKQHLHDCNECFPADVFISRLDISDWEKLKREEKDWEDTRYGTKIIDALSCIHPETDKLLEDKTAFYAIETPTRYGEKQIRAIAMVTKKKNSNNLTLDFIQVNNDPCMPDIIQGAGSCLLYAVINFAKKCGIENFSLFSNTAAKGFYKHNHLRHSSENQFYLTKSLYDKNLQALEEKYSIQPTKKEEPLL